MAQVNFSPYLMAMMTIIFQTLPRQHLEGETFELRMSSSLDDPLGKGSDEGDVLIRAKLHFLEIGRSESFREDGRRRRQRRSRRSQVV